MTGFTMLALGEILTVRMMEPTGVALDRPCHCRVRYPRIVKPREALPLRPGLQLRVTGLTHAGPVLQLVIGSAPWALLTTVINRYLFWTDTDGMPVLERACAAHAGSTPETPSDGDRAPRPACRREAARSG